MEDVSPPAGIAWKISERASLPGLLIDLIGKASAS
jgi:hypothetical protein